MPEADLLYAIIKKVEKSTPLDTTSQTRVEVDLTPNRPKIFKQHDYYLVSHNVEAKAGLVVMVDSFEQSWVLNLAIDYIVTTSKNGLPDKVARTVVDGLRSKGPGGTENAQLVLETYIRNWVNRYISENGGKAEFIRQLERHTPYLSAYIRSQAEREIGLDLIPKIRPTTTGQQADEFMEVKPCHQPIKIELQDYATAINGNLNLSLAALPGAWAYVHYSSLEKLCTRLAAQTQMFMRGITLHRLHFEPEKVREELAAELDKVARTEGRTIQNLKLPCSSPISPEVAETAIRIRSITCSQKYFLIEYPHPIEVTCALQMELKDLGAFVANKSPNLERWAETMFGDIIQKHLLDVSYIALFRQPESNRNGETGFETFDRKIEQTKKAIREAAAKIGFEAYSIALRTNLQFDELRREFRIAIDRGQGEFEMDVPNCPAALDIEVTACIESQNIIKDLFRQDADIKKVIRKELKEKISNQLKETSPERYYVNFYRTHEKGKKSLVEELQEIIRTAMQKYEATVLTVSCVPNRTGGLWDIFEDLMREERQFNVQAEISELDFNVVFRVESVVPRYWYEFQTKRPNLERIQTKVEHCVGEWLASKSRDELLYRADELLKAQMNERVSASVGEEFGIVVKITHLTRLRSIEDDAYNEKVTGTVVQRIKGDRQEDEAELQALQHELQILYDREKAELANQNYDALPKLRELIRETQERLRVVGERLRLGRISGMLDRGIEANIGSLGGRGASEMGALPELAAALPTNRLAAGVGTAKANIVTDETVDRRR